MNNTSVTLDISSTLPNWEALNLTTENFSLNGIATTGVGDYAKTGGTLSISSYSNGIITIYGSRWGSSSTQAVSLSTNVYCTYFE